MIRATSGQKKIALAVTGGIAAYKAVEVLRALLRGDCDVRVIMTADAQKFVGVTTFRTLSQHPVLTDLYDYSESPTPHVDIADWADLFLVVPATANVIAKISAGIGDDAHTSALLAAHTPVLIAPAMNTHMWNNPATQANVHSLTCRGYRFVSPQSGLLACGYTGNGKLAEVDEIVSAACKLLDQSFQGASQKAQDLSGQRLLITAGPTHEAIDPVRFLANASTGKLGFTVAAEAARRGADVVLVAGPVSLETPCGVRRVDVISADQMLEAAESAFKSVDAAILTAAVADYTPVMCADHKLKKEHEPLVEIKLKETTDILATLSAQKGNRIVVGFAAETNNLLQNAQAKLERKGADMIVANDVSRADSTFGADTDRVAFVSKTGIEQLETLPLAAVANAVLDKTVQLLKAR